jgi:hypothetical protein
MGHLLGARDPTTMVESLFGREVADRWGRMGPYTEHCVRLNMPRYVALGGRGMGPGQRVMGRQTFATDACRKRAAQKIA